MRAHPPGPRLCSVTRCMVSGLPAARDPAAAEGRSVGRRGTQRLLRSARSGGRSVRSLRCLETFTGNQAQRLRGRVIVSRTRRPGTAQGGEALDALPCSAPSALVNPSRSATVTVRAEWPLRRRADGTFSAKWMHTPALWFVPKLKPSSTMDWRTPNAVHQR
jgi:hypothetical protein